MTATPELALNAERTLRPTEADLASAWREVVQANAEQEARLRETDPFEDYWAPGRREHPIYHVRHETNQPVLGTLQGLAATDDVWLDVGAGSGSTAIYLSQFVRKFVGIDPSPGMTALMREHVLRYEATRVEVLEEDSWPPTRPVEKADVCMAEHVTYFASDIVEFLDAMEAHARKRCVVVANERGTGWQPVPALFEEIHNERHIKLTGATELLTVLYARRRLAQVTILPLVRTPGPEDLEDALARVRDDYYLRPGSTKDDRLRELILQHFKVAENKVIMPPGAGAYTAVISWAPPA